MTTEQPILYIEDRMREYEHKGRAGEQRESDSSAILRVSGHGWTMEASRVIQDCIRKHGLPVIDRDPPMLLVGSADDLRWLSSALGQWLQEGIPGEDAHRIDSALHSELMLFQQQLGKVLAGEARSRESVVRVMKCRELPLPLGERTLIMGILNMTPDSFSDGGSYPDLDAAVRRAKQMVEEGADIIDIGGESTRPGAEPVPPEIELERVIPVVAAVRSAVTVPVSIDTTKAIVAQQALEAGAHIVNDQQRLLADREMARVVARFGCPVILMHNRPERVEGRLLAGIVADLQASIRVAHESGIADDQIIIDPGIGFAKSYEQNLQTMNLLRPIALMGYPVLLGTSRKSMIRLTLDLPPNEVIEGTLATTAYGIAQGCQIIRVHDVRENKKTAVMMDALRHALRT